MTGPRPKFRALSGSGVGANVNIRALGSTMDGSEWAIRALHPCDDTRGGGTKIPDLAADMSAAVEDRHTVVVGAPSGTAGNWDLQVASLGLPDMPLLYRRRKTGEDWPNGGSWSIAFSLDSLSYKPGKFKFAFKDQGICHPEEMLSQPDLLRDATQYRGTFKGLTMVMNANAIQNQGIVTAGQWGNKPSMGVFKASSLPPTEPEYARSQEVETAAYLDFPETSDTIVQKVPNAGQWEARRGVYMPMRFEDTVHLYQSGSDGLITNSDGTRNLSGSIVAIGRPGGNIVDSNFILVSSGSGGTTYYTTAGAMNYLVGTVFFEGLDHSASILMKVRQGLEIVPDAQNPLKSAVLNSPEKDEVALDMVKSVNRRLPLAYEHKYNSLGFLLPLLGKVATAVLPTVMPWLAKKANDVFFNGRQAPRREIVELEVD